MAICVGKKALFITALLSLFLLGCKGESSSIADPVDLGLSVKWASWNLGASSPEDFGSYISWGEVEPKQTYTWETYSFCAGDQEHILKYCVDPAFGTVDDLSTLDPEDDIARAKWGEGWRMATPEEWEELLNECDWTWTTSHGVNGYLVKSKKKGYTSKSIFLPAGGNCEGAKKVDEGSFGHYWTSSVNMSYTYDARSFFFRSGRAYIDYYYRYYGFLIRPVTK